MQLYVQLHLSLKNYICLEHKMLNNLTGITNIQVKVCSLIENICIFNYELHIQQKKLAKEEK